MQRQLNKSPMSVSSKRLVSDAEMTLRRSKRRGELSSYKPRATGIQYLVEEQNKQMDEYMLTQIKRNKKSIKRLQKQIDNLKDHMINIHANNGRREADHHIIPRTKHQNNQVHRNGTVLKRKSFCQPEHSVSCQIQGKKDQFATIPSSKLALKHKIQSIKSSAQLSRADVDKIKMEVNQKIQRKQKQYMVDYGLQRPTKDTGQIQSTKETKYQQLMLLLETNKKMLEKGSRQTVKPIHAISVAKQISMQQDSKDSSDYEMADKPFQSNVKNTNRPISIKSGVVYSQYIPSTFMDSHFPQQNSEETNLLQSQGTVNLNKKDKMSLNRCLEIQVAQFKDTSSQFDAFFPMYQRKTDLDSQYFGKSEIRQLQSKFDHLVRKEILCKSNTEKKQLSQSIRNILSRLTQLKSKQSRHKKYEKE